MTNRLKSAFVARAVERSMRGGRPPFSFAAWAERTALGVEDVARADASLTLTVPEGK